MSVRNRAARITLFRRPPRGQLVFFRQAKLISCRGNIAVIRRQYFGDEHAFIGVDTLRTTLGICSDMGDLVSTGIFRFCKNRQLHHELGAAVGTVVRT